MNAHSQPKLSLIERAAQVYDFQAAVSGRDDNALRAQPRSLADVETFVNEVEFASIDGFDSSASHTEDVKEAPVREALVRPSLDRIPLPKLQASVDRAALEERGFVLPDAPVDTLAEEFRIIKRSLLSQVRAKGAGRGQVVMVCSARPDDGKTFTAVNLGLSLAGERDVEVLLVDGDVAKPEVLSTLGLEGDTGLLDALANASMDVENLVIRTNVGGLSVLPAGRQAHDATELLASSRMAELLTALTSSHPNRIVLFDSPPALAASAASAIAGHAGQVVMVVRADRTSDADLREAVSLVAACPDVRLVLNGATQLLGKKRFSYYGADL